MTENEKADEVVREYGYHGAVLHVKRHMAGSTSLTRRCYWERVLSEVKAKLRRVQV